MIPDKKGRARKKWRGNLYKGRGNRGRKSGNIDSIKV